MRFDLSNAGVWLSGTGAESEIVLSTRFRLARNIEEFNFKGKLSAESEEELELFLAPKVTSEKIGVGMQYVKMDCIDEVDRMLLLENHLISLEHLKAENSRGVAFDNTGSLSIMVNEEDHLRIQVLTAGLALHDAWKKTDGIDSILENELNYAFDQKVGFLTTCPTNVGTGLRISVMLHLPALVLSKNIEKVFNAVSQVNLEVRGFFGEGSPAVGDFYQISNQITLGITPQDIISSMERVLPKIIEYERGVRKALVTDERKVLEDKIWRAVGVLRYARCISSEETMTYLSALRLGVATNIFSGLSIEAVNKLFLDIQPGHLQKSEKRELDQKERDIIRANLIRSRLQEN